MTTLCLVDCTPKRRAWLVTLWPSGREYHVGGKIEDDVRRQVAAVFGRPAAFFADFKELNHEY